ncbi:putative UNC93-like protein MFSD11 [Hypsibius exemplaris]|uniref:UNC93-like protein MFSD11 n=1 Tax=Hypsibius exemplaris TaxID=2072580 RepID=A0A1W0X0D0_HYPEX|nr:putative UNC93-like protein MFSD11 [Hypsibius exemplaris]
MADGSVDEIARRRHLHEIDYVDFREGRTESSIAGSATNSVVLESGSHETTSSTDSADDRLSKRSICGVRVSFLNIILMGFGFMLNIGVYNSAGMAQTVVLNTVNDTYMVGYPTLGFNLFAVICGTQAFAYLFGPAVVAITGPKLGMVLGSVSVTFYLASFIRPIIWVLYISAGCAGFGVGIIWTVQGYFVTINSTAKRVLRNTGVFWGLYMSTLVTGNLFYFFMVRAYPAKGHKPYSQADLDILDYRRMLIFSILTAASALGVLVFSLVVHPWVGKIPRPRDDILTGTTPHNDVALQQQTFRGPKEAFLATVKFMFRKDMVILMPMFFYIGIEGCFWGSVYITALGYTDRFGERQEEMVGLAGVFAGGGEIAGGLILGLLGKWMHFNGKDSALMFGMILHIVACYLTFLNTPAESALAETKDWPYIGEPNPYLAMFVSFIFGLGDALWNNQLMAYLGEVYRHECVSVFAVYQFWCALAAALAFVSASFLTLPWQLLGVIAVSIPSAAGFCYVEWKSLRNHPLVPI